MNITLQNSAVTSMHNLTREFENAQPAVENAQRARRFLRENQYEMRDLLVEMNHRANINERSASAAIINMQPAEDAMREAINNLRAQASDIHAMREQLRGLVAQLLPELETAANQAAAAANAMQRALDRTDEVLRHGVPPAN